MTTQPTPTGLITKTFPSPEDAEDAGTCCKECAYSRDGDWRTRVLTGDLSEDSLKHHCEQRRMVDVKDFWRGVEYAFAFIRERLTKESTQ